jgi:predicted RNA binding protein with dsRBD fold (UPF0201 family)
MKKNYNTQNETSSIILNTNEMFLNHDLKKIFYRQKAKPYYFYKYMNKDFIESKNKFFSNNYYSNNYNNDFVLSCETSRKDFASQFPLKIKKKIHTGTQVNITEKSQKVSKNNNNIKLLKKLIDNSKINSNLEDINCVLESPYRGIEKMELVLTKPILQEKDLPIFIGDNCKGFFYKTKTQKSKSMPRICSRTKKRNIDKYNEMKKNEEFDSPLKQLSKISGVSCIQLRKVIDYSLSHRINNLSYFMKNNNINDTTRKILNHYIIDNNTSHSNKLNKDKSIYSIISLKSRKKNNSKINKNFSNNEKDISLDSVLGKNVFQDKFSNKSHYNKKTHNNVPIHLIKDSNIFNNLTIKDKIEAFYK